MKAFKFLRAVVVLMGILLSACAPSASSSAQSNMGDDKSLSKLTFAGAIESMDGSQWVIDGHSIEVDRSVLQDASFSVGDHVKVEALVARNGSITAQRVETPSAGFADISNSSIELTEAPGETPVSRNSPQPLVFDNSGNEASGTVDAITDTTITLNGQVFNLASGVEIKGDIVAGAVVKVHFTMNADGTFSVTEIEFADPTQMGEDNSTDGPNHDMNDDHGGASTSSSDDGSNHDTNDDNSGTNSGGGGNSGGNTGSGG